MNCKTQNSGLPSKEEKPRDPINQPSRCTTQEGLLSVAQTGDSDLLGGRAPGPVIFKKTLIFAENHKSLIKHSDFLFSGNYYLKIPLNTLCKGKYFGKIM